MSCEHADLQPSDWLRIFLVIELSPVTVLWNPSSGSTDRADAVMDELRRWPEAVIERPGSREAARELIASLKEHQGLLVAAGGDGTVSSVVDSVLRVGFQGTLGILPLGTGNDLSRSLAIPFQPELALDVLRHGQDHEVDVLEIRIGDEQIWCANMVTGGNTGRYMDVMTPELKSRWGPFCYLRGVVDVLQHMENFEIEIIDEDGGQTTERFSALNVFCANGRMSGGGLTVSPEAWLDDGEMDLIIVQEGDPGEIAGLTAEYLLSNYLEHDLVHYRRVRRIRISADPPMPFTADGDRIGESPLEVRIHPKKLRVRLPSPESLQGANLPALRSFHDAVSDPTG